MPNVPYPYEANSKLVKGNGSLIPISSLSNRSLLPSLAVLCFWNTVDYDTNSIVILTEYTVILTDWILKEQFLSSFTFQTF